MSDKVETPATPAGNAGAPGTAPGTVDVQAITKSVTDAVLASLPAMVTKAIEPISTQIADLGKANQSLAEKVNTIKPGEGVSAEAVTKIVTDQLAASNKASQDAAAANTARQAVIDKIVKDKLGGKAELGKLLAGATEQELTAHADALAAQVKALKPDFAGGSKDGGTPPIQPQPANTSALKGLSPGVAKFADSIKLPGEAPTSPSAPAAPAAAPAAK